MNSIVTHATAVTDDVEKAVSDMFEYHPWTAEQVAAGEGVRAAV